MGSDCFSSVLRSRSRSPRRGRSPDWSRHKGKTDKEMLEDLRARQRDRAVCSIGKDYHRKPIGFMSGLALKRDLGAQSTRLREEDQQTHAHARAHTHKRLLSPRHDPFRKPTHIHVRGTMQQSSLILKI
eukprot:3792152-Amphidinium_carterae.1